MIYRSRRLGDLCEVRIGRTPRRDTPAYWGGTNPWVTVRELNGGVIYSTNESISDAALSEVMADPVPAGTLLFSFKLSIGKMAVTGVPMHTNEAIAALVIRDPSELDRDYLRYTLMASSAGDEANHAVLGKVLNKAKVEAISIPVPSLAEQQRVVNLLARAEGIARLRREAQQKAAELVPAIFLDMFGDPATNPKGWPTTKLGDYLAINSSVRTPDLTSEAGMPCIGADSIASGTGKIVSWPTVGEIKPISGKYLFEVGDVLYSKIRPALRKVIVAPTSGYCSADMYPLRADAHKAVPEYVAALLLSYAFTEYAVGVSARAQMPKVNRETLFAYEHPLPPLSLQKVFAERVQAVGSIAEQQASATNGAELSFQSLLARSFSGRT